MATTNKAVHVLGVPEREKKGTRCLFLEIVVGNIPNLWREMDIRFLSPPQKIPEETNSKKSIQTHYNHIVKI